MSNALSAECQIAPSRLNFRTFFSTATSFFDPYLNSDLIVVESVFPMEVVSQRQPAIHDLNGFILDRVIFTVDTA